MDQQSSPRSRALKIVEQRLQSLQRAGVQVVARAPVAEPASASLSRMEESLGEAPGSETPQIETSRGETQHVETQHIDSQHIDSQHIEAPGHVAAAESVERETTGAAQGDTEMASTPQARRRLLAELKEEVAACVACQELASTRTQTVFGVGDPAARLCFFGEAPGADEDRQGEPFVGRAGKLLTDIIQKGMGLERSDVYILNTLKCRPPGNRNPTPEEVSNCRHFFERQLDLIQPEFLCCLGLVAAQAVLDTKLSLGKLRGRFHDFRGMQVLCTYHPAYLLRNPDMKKKTWEDVQILMQALGLPTTS